MTLLTSSVSSLSFPNLIMLFNLLIVLFTCKMLNFFMLWQILGVMNVKRQNNESTVFIAVTIC